MRRNVMHVDEENDQRKGKKYIWYMYGCLTMAMGIYVLYIAVDSCGRIKSTGEYFKTPKCLYPDTV